MLNLHLKLSSDRVLVSTGRHPCTDDLGLEVRFFILIDLEFEDPDQEQWPDHCG